jgi:phosphodiesterase/alkaline phosphatase D-like protein
MEKNTALIGGGIALIAILGSAFYFAQNRVPTIDGNATSTPSTNTNTQTRNPSAPTAVTSPDTTAFDTSAIVTGTIVPNGVFTSYWFEYGLSTDMDKRTNVQIIGSGYSSLPSPGYITGLTKNTKYYYRLVAQNEFSKVMGSTYTFETTNNGQVQTGSVPTIKTVGVTTVTNTQASLNGEVSANNAPTQYWFEYGKTSNLGSITGLQTVGSASVKIPVSSSISNLDPDTTYFFRLNAQNQFGTINGTTISFKTAGGQSSSATKPTVETKDASTLKTTSAKLHGTVDPNGSQTIYWFEYSTDSLLGTLLLSSTDHKSAGSGNNSGGVEADITGLKSNTNYYYRVVAENAGGLVYGNNVSFRTK